MNEEQVKNFITATGAISEAVSIYYFNSIKLGFNEDQALVLAGKYQDNLFKFMIASGQMKGENDNA